MNDKHVDNKTQKFQAICRTINKTLEHKTRKETNFYKTVVVLIFTDGSKAWIMNTKNKSNTQIAEMRFL